jgi:POT family proton-dependent oligopeptide transporter
MPLDVIIILIGAIFSGTMIWLTYATNRHIQPKQLFLLFFTEMWERFSFYGMRALLMLYMVKVLMYADKDANLMYGSYNALVYLTPLFGGLIADRILGFRKSIIWGGILMAIGHLVLAIPADFSFFLGLGFLIIGNGFFKPNISSFLGNFYETNDKRRDAGYNIFYMGINIGAFLGSALCGYLGQKVNWHLGFGTAGVLMVAGLIIFLLNQKMLEDKGYSPNPKQLNAPIFAGISLEKFIYIGSALCVGVAVLFVKRHEITDILFPLLGIAMVAYIIYLSVKEDGKSAKEMIWAALSMICISTLFWGFYEQSGGSLNLMAERNVDMVVFGNSLSSAMVNNSINPFYIILLSPFFAKFWFWLDARKLKPSDPMKFALAFLLLGIGYFIFVAGCKMGATTGMMPLLMFAAGYFFITCGELFLSPVGLSMITKLSPAKAVGMMMGAWFFASACGHHLGGWIGSKMAIDDSITSPVQSLPIYMSGCQTIGLISISGAIFMFLFSFVVKKWMHGVE